MRHLAVCVVCVVMGLLCTGAAAQQTQPRPGPGTGIVPVTGRVEIANTPSVNALQVGDWEVAVGNTPDVRIANTPAVTVAAPEFLKKGSRYVVTWSPADRETVTIAQIGPGGWIGVAHGARTRWVNLAIAHSIEEER